MKGKEVQGRNGRTKEEQDKVNQTDPVIELDNEVVGGLLGAKLEIQDSVDSQL